MRKIRMKDRVPHYVLLPILGVVNVAVVLSLLIPREALERQIPVLGVPVVVGLGCLITGIRISVMV